MARGLTSRLASLMCLVTATVSLVMSCRPTVPTHDGPSETKTPASNTVGDKSDATTSSSGGAGFVDSAKLSDAAVMALLADASSSRVDGGGGASVSLGDPMKNHHETREELLSLFTI